MSTPASTPETHAVAPPAPPPGEQPPAAPPAPSAVEHEQPLGDGGVKALQAERARAAKAEADLKAYRQEIEDSKKSAEQKAQEALTAARAQANEAATRALRYEVAAAKGLDLALAARLSGSTKEELEADADALMALIPKAPETTPPAPPTGPTVPGQQPGGAQTPALVTQADLDALAAAGKYDQINKLRREGRLSHLGVAPPKG